MSEKENNFKNQQSFCKARNKAGWEFVLQVFRNIFLLYHLTSPTYVMTVEYSEQCFHEKSLKTETSRIFSTMNNTQSVPQLSLLDMFFKIGTITLKLWPMFSYLFAWPSWSSLSEYSSSLGTLRVKT